MTFEFNPFSTDGIIMVKAIVSHVDNIPFFQQAILECALANQLALIHTSTAEKRKEEEFQMK